MTVKRILKYASALSFVVALDITLATWAIAAENSKHSLIINDVLDTVSIERATTSPDGEWVAAVIQRPARQGEVFGRTSYEVDPSRNDVWLISSRTGERRNVTQGQEHAAGFWCATWSPTGDKLAILSTRPERAEPRGGDNVHLYVWDRASDKIRRITEAPVMTQTRYSSLSKLDLRGGAGGGGATHNCQNGIGMENAPFAWLDDGRLLTVTLPAGQVSALIDEGGRPFDRAAKTWIALRDGVSPTVSAMGSGAERISDQDHVPRAIIRIVNADTQAASILGEVPAYPFEGSLTLSVSPNGEQIAVLAPRGAIPPTRDLRIPKFDGEWMVEKQLGIVALAGAGKVRWLAPPEAARYPLELLDWAPDSRTFSFRARARFEDTSAALFAADVAAEIRPASPIAEAQPGRNTDPSGALAVLPKGAELLEARDDAILWRKATKTGLHLGRTLLLDGKSTRLLTVNTHLASVDWGETRLVDYLGAGGQSLKAAVLLPPGYQEGTRYPVITWVYQGYVVRTADEFVLNPYMPGIHNMRLYAAQGYVVLVPSIPSHRILPGNDPKAELADNVLPAVDKLIGLGIADPERLGLWGHSFGGHSVYTLVTQTNRFKAAVALSGLTDIAQAHGQFDPTASGYPGIEHEKSRNWTIFESGRGFGQPPYEDPSHYSNNSPIANVGRVETPLLMIHGEFDIRGGPAQAETFFHALYRQGKTARLLRYWGESHGLGLSPANIRDIVHETLDWLDRYLPTRAR